MMLIIVCVILLCVYVCKHACFINQPVDAKCICMNMWEDIKYVYVKHGQPVNVSYIVSHLIISHTYKVKCTLCYHGVCN